MNISLDLGILFIICCVIALKNCRYCNCRYCNCNDSETSGVNIPFDSGQNINTSPPTGISVDIPTDILTPRFNYIEIEK